MNTVYENTVLETKLTELLNSDLEVRALMTIDDSLTEGAGLTKVINRYTFHGEVEQLYAGETNGAESYIYFTPETYTVKRYQQTFRYNDMEVMRDPAMIDAALKGMADAMGNQIRQEYFDQLRRIRNRHPFSGDTVAYTDIVEALGNIGREVEDGLFIIMGTDARTAIRLNPDFIAARQGEILYSGQFGTLCGIPVLFSRLVPANTVIITEKAAVKFFVKREAGLEQVRDIETKDNTVVYERHGLIALVDDTSSVILGKGAPEMVASITRTEQGLSLTASMSDSERIYYTADADAALLGENVSHWRMWNGGIITKLDENAERISIALTDKSGVTKKSISLPLA